MTAKRVGCVWAAALLGVCACNDSEDVPDADADAADEGSANGAAKGAADDGSAAAVIGPFPGAYGAGPASTSEPAAAGGVEDGDVLDVTLDGERLPLVSDPDTFSVVLDGYVNAGFAASIPAFGDMAAGTFSISVSVSGTDAGSYPVTAFDSDVGREPGPLAHVSLTRVDLSRFDSSDGDVKVERLEIGTDGDGARHLELFRGSFDATFIGDDGEPLEASGRFQYD